MTQWGDDAAGTAPAVSRSDVAKGAGLAGLSRLGALIEIVAQPAYTWMFGLTSYGLYIVLWAAVNILANLLDLAMGQALQRIIPAEKEREAQHYALRVALLVSTGLGVLAALLLMAFAQPLAGFISSDPENAENLPRAIMLFAPTLPLWIFVETATAAARAKRAFGPEIRLRIFWEQVARLGFVTLLYLAGFGLEGLLLGHLLSLLLTAILALRLLNRYYDLRLVFAAPPRPALRRNLLASGLALLPPALARRAFNDLPPILLNVMMAGAAGATAAGLYGISRKVASIPLIVRQSFLYVLAPLSSAQGAADRTGVAPLYSFATHMSLLLAVPIAGFMILVASDILSGFAPGSEAALPILILLLVARAGEAVIGPATPIVEMIGHRILPLLNSLLGLVIWVILAIWLVPEFGVTGMAIAVAVGVVVTAWAAAVELQISDDLSPFGKGFWRATAAALLFCLAMWLAGVLLAPHGAPVRAIGLLLLFWPLLWLVLHFGMLAEDKEALGGLAKWLRL